MIKYICKGCDTPCHLVAINEYMRPSKCCVTTDLHAEWSKDDMSHSYPISTSFECQSCSSPCYILVGKSPSNIQMRYYCLYDGSASAWRHL